jgi:gliding motility-associated-like protein
MSNNLHVILDNGFTMKISIFNPLILPMPYKKLLLLFVLLFTCINTFSAVFVVTSNADSGPGTLRDALTQAAANGSASKDYINFNIVDQSLAGRTITILTTLPQLSSNLVIDASTEPAAPIGSSDTKIIITETGVYTGLPDTRGFFGQNIHDLEFYGIYFKIFYSGQRYATPIYLSSAQNIVVGQPGKGNVFGSIEVDMDFYGCTNIKISSNTFGKDPFTGQIVGFAFNCGPRMYYCSEIFVGGDTAAEGNLFVGRDVGDLLVTGYDPYTGSVALQGKYCYVKNNQFGTAGVYNGSSCSISEQNDVLVTDNSFGGSGLDLKNLAVSTNVRHNVFTSCGVSMDNCSNVNIGGPLTNDSIYCNTNGIPYHGIPYQVQIPTAPLTPISITSINNGLMVGKSVPNAIIEVFTDSECKLCDAKKTEGTTLADANGDWSFAAPTGIGLTASATLNNTTSLFLKPTFDLSKVVVTNATCGNNGSISGAVVTNGLQIEWRDANNVLVGTTANVNNLNPGIYHVNAMMGACTAQGSTYVIKDGRPRIAVSNLQVKNVSCGIANGSVSGIYIANSGDFTVKTIKWFDQFNQTVGNSLNLQNVSAGSYKLEVTNSDGCSGTYGPVTLTNTSGPNIDQSTATITPNNCGQSTGSIIGITVTAQGTLTYSWKNALQQQVATTKDLLNQPAGQYTLTVTDQSSCGPITSAAIAIPEANGIAIDTSAKAQTPAVCGQTTGGSITNIKVTGATNYQWFNSNGISVSTQTDLTNVAAGRYYLVASNAFCSKQTMVFAVVQQGNTINYGGLTKVLKNATCGLNNGLIQVIFMNNPPVLPAKYRWVNSNGQTVGGNSATLTGIDAGTYQLYVSDSNGCEKYLISYSIGSDPALTVTTNNVQLTDDHCQTGTGSIKGIGYTGKTPVKFVWTDISGAIIANTIDLANVKAGTYAIKITDGSGCEQDLSYTINNTDTAIPLPAVTNVQLCTTGTALIAVNNPSSLYGFKLYDSATSAFSVSQSASGKFNVVIGANRSYFISQYIGTCESSRAEVKVSLGLSKLSIANTFTPNNDGINDTWKISGMENYPDGTVQIYNRIGQLVFESKGYTSPFDGRMKGQDLPVGTYYYIINLNTKCDVISGTLTLLR